VYIETGRAKDGVKLLSYVVKMGEKMQTVSTDSKRKAQIGLAEAYGKDGKVTKAIQLWDAELEVQKKMLPEGQVELLEMTHKLATACMDDGQPEKATESFEKLTKDEGGTVIEGSTSQPQHMKSSSEPQEPLYTHETRLLRHSLLFSSLYKPVQAQATYQNLLPGPGSALQLPPSHIPEDPNLLALANAHPPLGRPP
jgi:hypothetical protein